MSKYSIDLRGDYRKSFLANESLMIEKSDSVKIYLDSEKWKENEKKKLETLFFIDVSD